MQAYLLRDVFLRDASASSVFGPALHTYRTILNQGLSLTCYSSQTDAMRAPGLYKSSPTDDNTIATLGSFRPFQYRLQLGLTFGKAPP